jgi:hypothetical protein
MPLTNILYVFSSLPYMITRLGFLMDFITSIDSSKLAILTVVDSSGSV